MIQAHLTLIRIVDRIQIPDISLGRNTRYSES
jgi:hypothetical protein